MKDVFFRMELFRWSLEKGPQFRVRNDTVDGKNPAVSPVEVGNLPHYLPRFYTSQVVGNGISEPSERSRRREP